MRAPVWWSGDPSPPRLLRGPLRVAAGVFAAGTFVHRQVRASSLAPARRLPCRVVSVGSIVAGGAGKSPTAAWLAERLHLRGHRVALATRGYAGRAREGVHVLSDGQRIRSDPTGLGDESLVLAAHAPGVPVLIARDRGLAGLRAVGAFDSEILVLDDGFQHHRLHRDVDIVTLDGDQGLGNGHVIPLGPMREPVSALARAIAIGVVDGPLDADCEARVDEHAPHALRYRARRRPVSLRRLRDGAAADLGWLRGKEVGVLVGVGHPPSVSRTVESLGAKVIARRVVPNHHRYRARDLRGLSKQAAIWITTEKDAGKILPSWVGAVDLRVVGIEVEVEEEALLLELVEARLGVGL
ncbi:MAG: tetraacyldisaccharide 4'-kinase [Deltaproteobacteria bacterium]|jgi:tetraacyldisaccharide 4'-kinase|nr:tetraacyldisaccharide 4'-kinase [Deltaproteobacteria bacterium]MBW2385384.1 tetraacyldisaccharide 4'-kinase [Deltaproteobacteria bacterium]